MAGSKWRSHVVSHTGSASWSGWWPGTIETAMSGMVTNATLTAQRTSRSQAPGERQRPVPTIRASTDRTVNHARMANDVTVATAYRSTRAVHRLVHVEGDALVLHLLGQVPEEQRGHPWGGAVEEVPPVALGPPGDAEGDGLGSGGEGEAGAQAATPLDAAVGAVHPPLDPAEPGAVTGHAVVEPAVLAVVARLLARRRRWRSGPTAGRARARRAGRSARSRARRRA